MGGPDTFFPVQAISRKQTAVSHSTPEAEIVAADLAVRVIGIPSLSLWDRLFDRDVVCLFHEDNAAMIQVCRTGKNPTMRHMGRTHRVDVLWLHERFKEPWLHLFYTKSSVMRADIFTKGFDQPDKWAHALDLINHVDPKTFFRYRPAAEVTTFSDTPLPVPGGGMLYPLRAWRLRKNGSIFHASGYVIFTEFSLKLSGPRVEC